MAKDETSVLPVSPSPGSSISSPSQSPSPLSEKNEPRAFSTLPELTPYTSYPEVAAGRDRAATAPRPGKHNPDVPLPAGILPPPFNDVHQLDGEDANVAEKPRQVAWWRRKRNRWILLGLALLALLVIIGVAVGVGVPLSRRKGDNAQGASGGGSGGSGGSGGDGQGSPPPGSGPGAGPEEPPTPLDFGTPITFSGQPEPSVCDGTVCPQSVAVAEFGSLGSSIFMFVRGSDNAIWFREIRNSAWRTSEWKNLGGKFMSQPTASSMREGRVDVFGIWDDQTTRLKTFQNGVWETEWTSLGGGNSSSPPAACSAVRDNVNVIYVGSDHAIYHKNATDGNSWAPSLAGNWEALGGSVYSSIDVGCATGSDKIQRMDIVGFGGQGSDRKMYFKRWNSTGRWQEWVGGKGPAQFKGNPTLVSTPERVDYFGVGEDGGVWTVEWTSANGYSEPLNLGGSFQSAVSAVVIDSKSRLDIVAVGNDKRLKHRGRSHGLWGTEWEDLGGSFNSAPKVVLLNSTSVGVFGIGPDGAVIHSTFTLGTGYYWGGEGQWYSDGGAMASTWYG